MHIGCSFSPQWRSDERHSTTLFWFQKKKRHMEDDLDISDITSLASSLLYEGGNKSRSWDKNLRKFNSLTSNFLPLPRYHAAVHRYIWDQTWWGPWVDAARFEERVNFSPEQWPYFSQLGHCHIWRQPGGAIVIVHSWDAPVMMTTKVLVMMMVISMILMCCR